MTDAASNVHDRPTSPARIPLLAMAAITVVVFLADLGTKVWALNALEPGAYVPVFGDLFGLQLTFNPGAAFSFGDGLTWVLTVVAGAVTVVIIKLSLTLRSWRWALALAALLGGTLGNLFDRLFRDPGFGVGHVVDFLNYNGWFIGNVADIFIVGAAIGIGILGFVGVGIDGQRHTSAPAKAADTDTSDTEKADG